MSQRELVILGGGPAGLATAFYAHERGLPFTLFEKTGELGGLCRTVKWGNHRYDTGAHRFHDRVPEVTADLRRLLGDQLVKVQAPSKVLLGRRLVEFPPAPLDLLTKLRGAAFRVGLDYLRSRMRRRTVESFEDYAVLTFGETLAGLFLLNYSQKLWGLPAHQLSPCIATRRLSGMTFRSLLVELFFPGRKQDHIDGSFLYPRLGYGQIVEALIAGLPRERLIRQAEITGLECRNGRIQTIRFRDRAPYPIRTQQVVCTLPLGLVIRLLKEFIDPELQELARTLRFRHLRLFYLRLQQPRLSENASIYIPHPEVCVTRIYEPKNRSPQMAPPGETGIVAEIPFFEGEPLGEVPAPQMAERVISQLASLGLLDPERVLDWDEQTLWNAYPVYSLDYLATVRRLLEALRPLKNLTLLGRNALFSYTHLHDQMRSARDFIAGLGPDRRTP